MSSGVILLQRPYISFSSPLLLILRREITAAAVVLFVFILHLYITYTVLQDFFISSIFHGVHANSPSCCVPTSLTLFYNIAYTEVTQENISM